MLNRFKENIEGIDYNNIRRNLIPMLKVGTTIDIEELKVNVVNYIDKLLVLTKDEQKYVELYNQGKFKPSLLFEDENIVKVIMNHPMAIWKMINFNKK